MPSPHRHRGLTSRKSIAAAVITALALTSCGANASGDGDAAGSSQAPTADGASRSVQLVDVLRDHNLASAASAVETIGLEALTPAADYTFFVPSDDAFLELGADQIADLFADSERLIGVLRDHVSPGQATAANLIDLGTVTSENGTQWEVDRRGEDVTVGGAQITEADIEVGSIGVVHVVDRLLGP